MLVKRRKRKNEENISSSQDGVATEEAVFESSGESQKHPLLSLIPPNFHLM
jgi:hypothetical protein